MGTTDTKINRATAAEIQAERAAAKMTVEELSAKSGIAFGTLRRILKGTIDVNMADLGAICAAFTEKEKRPVLPSELVERAVNRAGGYDTL